jgi:hypothetical protein
LDDFHAAATAALALYQSGNKKGFEQSQQPATKQSGLRAESYSIDPEEYPAIELTYFFVPLLLNPRDRIAHNNVMKLQTPATYIG